MSTPGDTPPRWVLDPLDPRAPSREEWDAMTAAERAAVVDALPADPGWEVAPPEGDAHYEAADGPRKALRRFFGRTGRRAYVGTNLSVYYPREKVFAPDLLVVLDVDPHPRTRWVVTDERRGLDFVLEVHYAGDWRKDFVANVERYARLHVPEYFAFNLRTGVLVGHRLAPGTSTYAPLAPSVDGFHSEVLGLDLAVQGERVRFLYAGAALPELDELVSRLESAMNETMSRLGALELALEEERATAERERSGREAAELRIAELERLLAERKQT